MEKSLLPVRRTAEYFHRPRDHQDDNPQIEKTDRKPDALSAQKSPPQPSEAQNKKGKKGNRHCVPVKRLTPIPLKEALQAS
ncbi:MAG: hypothetical protein SVV80_03805, partial [Planctomycetota bacterium]|nr:hypothetical protein [Planctomycetota bacterium]